MSNIAVIGDKMSIFGFASAGIHTEVCETGDNAGEKLKKLVQDGYKIIYITEKAAEEAESVIEKYRFLPEPAIILIPGVTGNTGKGARDVGISVEKAIGSKIV